MSSTPRRRASHEMMTLLQRLKDRKLGQWALAYLAGAWLLLQVLHLLDATYRWPPVIMRSAPVLLAIGFFAALVIAWYHGEKGRQRVSGPELLILALLLLVAGIGMAWVGRETGVAILVLLVVFVLLLAGVGLIWTSGEAAAAIATQDEGPNVTLTEEGVLRPIARRSIAVLPFANLSENKDNEYFSDGITDEILTTLANVRDLRVISRTSVMRYKGSTKLLREIAGELGVAHILEGSVQRAGDRVRITAQLVDARTDEHLWAERYDRPLQDIFGLQSEIARHIARALQAQLSVSEEARLTRHPTTNLAAYDSVLRARELVRLQTPRDNEAALSLLREAHEMDPSYPDALAALSDCMGVQYWMTGDPTWLDSAVLAARHASTLDPNLASGHSSLGWALDWRGDRDAALEAHHHAIQLNPNLTGGLANVYHFGFGRLDEAARWWAPALESDPTNNVLYWLAGRTYLELGMFSRAKVLFEKGLEFSPGDMWIHFLLSTLFMIEGRRNRAEDQIRKMLTTVTAESDALVFAGYLYAALDDLPAARRCLERGLPEASAFDDFQGAMALAWILHQSGEVERARQIAGDTRLRYQKRLGKRTRRPEDYLDLARIMVLEGQTDEALQQMEMGVRRGWRFHHDRVDFILNSLRGDPRYDRLTAEVEAEIARMRARVERKGW
jgi:TolB-like protein/Flp pilus assembly protein TadD